MKIPWRVALWYSVDLLIIVALAAMLALLFAGCGSERDTRKREVEKVETITGPLIVDTPLGQFVAQPVKHTMIRTEDTVEREEKRISMPEVGTIMAATPALAGPLGIAGTLLGAITTAAAGWAAMRRGKIAREEAEARETAERQRDEIIDGIEAAKPKLASYGGAWDSLTTDLERKQSRDTVDAVKARVG